MLGRGCLYPVWEIPPLPLIFFLFFFSTFSVLHCPLWEMRVTPGKVHQLQEQCYSFLPVSAVFFCVQTIVWISVFGLFNVHTNVDARGGLYRQRMRDFTGIWHWKKNPLPHQSQTCLHVVPGFSVNHLATSAGANCNANVGHKNRTVAAMYSA